MTAWSRWVSVVFGFGVKYMSDVISEDGMVVVVGMKVIERCVVCGVVGPVFRYAYELASGPLPPIFKCEPCEEAEVRAWEEG